MSATIATRKEVSVQPLPWYRYGWPWFLISIPMVSVCLGSVMLYLAFNANNSLVVDDYYKEGKAYNLRIERDRLASLLGLTAVVRHSSEGLVLELAQDTPDGLPEVLEPVAQTARENYTLPEVLRLRWIHVTEATRDGDTQLQFIGGNRYIAQSVSLPTQGKFRLHIEPAPASEEQAVPAAGDWRLISALSGYDSQKIVTIPAPEPIKVFTRATFQ